MEKLRFILSSLRCNCGPDYAAHQAAAMATWMGVAQEIALFNNDPDSAIPGVSRMQSVTSVPVSDEPPTVYEMLSWATNRLRPDDVIAIVNSDIRLSAAIMKCCEIRRQPNIGRCWAATSFRYEGPSEEVMGQGLDVFVMSVETAKRVLLEMPKFMTVGRGLWDNWMNAWLRRNLRDHSYYNMTPWRCVFHPLHDRIPGRLSNYTEDQVRRIMSSGHLDHRGIPSTVYP